VENIKKLVAMGSEVKDVEKTMFDEETADFIEEQSTQLVLRYPEIRTEKGRKEFFGAVYRAGEAVGFSREEMNSLDR